MKVESKDFTWLIQNTLYNFRIFTSPYCSDPEVWVRFSALPNFSEKQWVWTTDHSASWVQLRSYLKEKSSGSGLETRNYDRRVSVELTTWHPEERDGSLRPYYRISRPGITALQQQNGDAKIETHIQFSDGNSLRGQNVYSTWEYVHNMCIQRHTTVASGAEIIQSCRTSSIIAVGSDIATAVLMRSSILCDITPCSPSRITRRFGGTCRLLPVSRRFFCLAYFSTLKLGATRLYEMYIDFEQTTRRYVPEGTTLHYLLLLLLKSNVSPVTGRGGL
jgi:hypothetical protein